MYRYVFILFFALGVVGLSSSSYAQIDLDCSAAVKCVCESQNHVRVVECPDDYATEDGAIDCTGEGLPEWTCGIDCSAATAAVCDEIPFECKRNEVKNCLVTLPMSVSATGSVCEEGETDCSGQCVDTDSDAQNCGECNNICGPDESCNNGNCESILVCPPGTENCSGDGVTCIDTTSDPQNCGACGNFCSSGQSCTSGQCLLECQAGETLCGGAVCADLNSDPVHCGDCNTPCGPLQACISGSCM